MIPYGHQSIDESDLAAVERVLRSDWLTQGPTVADFEGLLAELVGARFAVAYSSGTAALHGAAAAGGLGPGAVLATSPLSFAASATCARYVGAEASFVDIDPATLNLDPSQVPSGLDALVAVHYAGLPVDLRVLAHRPRVVIEDAAHAIGATTPYGPVGNCAHSDMTTFSFHPVKTVTTAEGGAVTTNDPELAERLRRFRNHGMAPNPEQGGWSYEISEVGYNYRLSDVHAALGASQLRRLDEFVDRRNEIAAVYRDLLAGAPLQLPPEAGAGWRHAYHLFAVRVPDRRRVYDAMRAAGIGVQVHYVPIHHHPLYARDPAWELPNTEAAYAGLLSLPIHPELSDADQRFVVETLVAALP